MTLPSSGSLSLSQVQGEHGGSLPLSMSSLLRGAPSKLVHANNTAIPAAAPMSLNQFRGTSRFGNYPMTTARWQSNSNPVEYQQGYFVSIGGTLSFNRNYKGHLIRSIAWNESTDGLIAVGFDVAGVPQSALSSLTTSKIGTRSVTAYYADFWGTTLFVFGTASVTPFATAGTVDNSIVLL